MVTTHYKEAVFTEKGFRNWKKALEENKGFKKHQQIEAHKAATLGLITIPETTKDISQMIDNSIEKARQRNRLLFANILRSFQFLLCQGMAIRGSWDPDKGIEDSNFIALLRFSCAGKPNIDINEWLSKK